MNELLSQFILACPKCFSENLKLETCEKIQGIREKICIKCDCGFQAFQWLLPEATNLALQC